MFKSLPFFDIQLADTRKNGWPGFIKQKVGRCDANRLAARTPPTPRSLCPNRDSWESLSDKPIGKAS